LLSALGFATTLFLLHINLVHVNLFHIFTLHVNAKLRSRG
jgi:hypothetical protein